MSGNRYVIDYNNSTCFVKLNEYPLNQGLFYRKDNGTIYISTLVRVEPFKNNYISFQNTGTTDINVDNISLRIWKIS